MTDPTAQAIFRCVQILGFHVVTQQFPSHFAAIAADRNGQTFEVKEADEYSAACLLAECVGIDLEDG